jgi:hypothetical protein
LRAVSPDFGFAFPSPAVQAIAIHGFLGFFAIFKKKQMLWQKL